MKTSAFKQANTRTTDPTEISAAKSTESPWEGPRSRTLNLA